MMYKNEGKKKIENLKLQERLSYGYKKSNYFDAYFRAAFHIGDSYVV